MNVPSPQRHRGTENGKKKECQGVLGPGLSLRLRVSVAVLGSVLMLTASFTHAQNTDERVLLQERQRQLETRIDALKQEQDLLLFKKQMYETDSKYLLLDLFAGNGTLKYRDRILRKISFTPLRSRAQRPQAGAHTLTARVDGQEWRRSLAFGTGLVLQARKDASDKAVAGPVRIRLSKGDMGSLFYALDVGSRAYVVR